MGVAIGLAHVAALAQVGLPVPEGDADEPYVTVPVPAR